MRPPIFTTAALLVLAAIRALPAAYRETLVLRLVEGMTGGALLPVLAALLLPVGALGALEYWRGGFVDLRFALLLAAGLLLGAYLGARLGISLPVEVVQRSFGVLLVIIGIRFAFFS